MSKETIAVRAKEVLKLARRLQSQGKNWVEVQNALYGPGGKCSKLFPTQADRTAYAKTDEFRQITEILNQLPDPPVQNESQSLEGASGNLHVRLPRSLHAALRREAEAEKVSLNQLIVAKLSMQLQALALGE